MGAEDVLEEIGDVRVKFKTPAEAVAWVQLCIDKKLCYKCGQKYARQVQVKSCIYNEPCGHRHVQGTLA